MTSIVIFPGQGSQFRGMGRELFSASPPEVRQASEILGYDIQALCLEDPDKCLNRTEYTQPALYVVNALSWQQYRARQPAPDYLAGHSLGEYSALLAAGAFDFATGLRLVQKRGQLMGKAGGGGMLAVLQTDIRTIRSVLLQCQLSTIDIANYNTPTQTILSGPRDDIARAEAAFAGHKIRCMPLNVSAAFHSRYMQSAAAEFASFLQGFSFRPLRIPVIANVTALPYETNNTAALLASQIAGAVQWQGSVRYLLGCAAQRGEQAQFVELGANPVLSRMTSEIQASQTSSSLKAAR